MMTVTITQVPNNLVAKLWSQCREHILKGEKYWKDYYSINDLKVACVSGNMQLWVQIIDKKIVTVLITSLISYPQAAHLRFIYIGGKELRVAEKYVYVIEQWARTHGASKFEFLARNGWVRYLEKFLAERNAIRRDFFVGDLKG